MASRDAPWVTSPSAMSTYPSSIATSPCHAPQSTSQIRSCSAANRPSTRGRPRSPSITPSNVPFPAIRTTRDGRPNAVNTPARIRSLSCQSLLTTWNGMRGARAVASPTFELDVGMARRQPVAQRQLDGIAVQRVRDGPAHWQPSWPGLCGQTARRPPACRPSTWRDLNADAAGGDTSTCPSPTRVTKEPRSQASRSTRCHAQPAAGVELEKVGEHGQVDAAILGFKGGVPGLPPHRMSACSRSPVHRRAARTKHRRCRSRHAGQSSEPRNCGNG